MKRLPILLSILLGASCLDGLAAPEFTPDSQPVGWLARPALTSTDISSGNETVFLSDYVTRSWSGDLVARGVDAQAFPTETYPWAPGTAASKLDALNWETGRKIAAGYKGDGVAFNWDSVEDVRDVKDGLGGKAEKVLNYVRGHRGDEEGKGEQWRAREHVLGDILHSTVAYWKHDDGTGRVYVGANDGMLHAFDAATGAEVFAYVPSMVIPNLKKLTNKPYVHSHTVDGGIAIGKVDDVGGTKTILVGSLGAGGKGVYALDITTPTAGSDAAAADKVLWEIAATGNFANLGYTYGTPRRALLEDGTAVVIFGNGYENSGNGCAVLYIVNVLTGDLVRAIDTGSGTDASPNGLSTPTLVDVDGNGKVDRVYAGDLDGQLWRFDLKDNNNTATKVYTTTPAQAITSPPAVSRHPLGGYMVLFGTGRTLTTGDLTDAAVHAVYGIWDGAPDANQTLLSQTLSNATYGTEQVRTVSRNLPVWTSHRGWKLELPAGERVTGEEPFEKNGRFYFVSTNPTVADGEGWLHEPVATTGGSPATPIFDLNADGSVDAADLATGCTVNAETGITCVPIAQALGPGVFSQPVYVQGKGFGTTFYAYHIESGGGGFAEPTDPGVSGGHFDFDLYHWGSEAVTTQILPTDLSAKKNLCAKTAQVALEYNKVSPTYCTVANGFPAGYGFMTSDGNPGACCENCAKNKKGQYSSRDVKFLRDITCNTYETVTGATGNQYAKIIHVHEYDDKYGVTGVNMLNASAPAFNLSNAIKDDTTRFKVLVMNQYLNPAATLSVGGEKYESVKTYGKLASETNANTLLSGLKTYTRRDVKTLIYNLPLDAFKSKDWWGDGKPVRAGLIPTQTGCVNKVDASGSSAGALLSFNSERFNGALTVQLIRHDTPDTALEFNHNGNGGLSAGERATYGWRVKQSEFNKWVLAEYTSFWHHPNGSCYGQQAWKPDPPEDPSDGTAGARPAGTADPTDGIFTGGETVKDVKTVVSADKMTTTTTTTYNNVAGAYVKTEVTNADGTVTVTQTFPDGTKVVTTISGEASLTGLGRTSNEALGGLATGRQSWRELVD